MVPAAFCQDWVKPLAIANAAVGFLVTDDLGDLLDHHPSEV